MPNPTVPAASPGLPTPSFAEDLSNLAIDAHRLASLLQRLLDEIFEDRRAHDVWGGSADYRVAEERLADMRWLMWTLSERVEKIDTATLDQINREAEEETAAAARAAKADA